ncbi:MAG TPA: isoprenylcysteine carboxylmethyltransferase family protein [Sandaracinaceae bacterium]
MTWVAVTGWIVYVLVAFVLRTLVQLRTTGSSGIVGLRPGAGALERIAGVLVVGAFALAPVAPFVGEPIADTALLGGTVVAVATAGTFAAQLTMAGSWRIGVDPSERTELVTRGLFALVRNPIFSFMILAATGIALSCPTPLALVAPALLLVGLELQVRIVEEPYLARVHGEAYLAYARRVGRFVPWIGRLRSPGARIAEFDPRSSTRAP